MTGSIKIQLINMGTRAAAFQAKLRSLHENHIRLLQGSTTPAPPSGVDIANTIKYFSQTLLTVLKDVPDSPLTMMRDSSKDQYRMSAYPNLEYGNLFNVLAMLLDVAPNIQYGILAFGKAVLQCLGCILPFLEKDLIDNLPYLTASSISVLPPSLHQDVINYLCYFILPFTITRQSIEDQECQACQSIAAVIMLVFQYSNNPAHHCQLLECLMALKQNVVKDLLCVIAYGTAASRSSAAKLLFYYWPAFNPNLFDRKGLLCKFTNDLVPFVCQRESCPNAGNAEAAKVCYDHSISTHYAPDSPPPLYLCIECANDIHREHPNQIFSDILRPMQQVSMVCENKNCRSSDKSAVSICFSMECASYNGNHPIRYCSQCHGNRHNSRRGGDHIVHRSLPPTWQMDAEMQNYMVEAIISLLREAKPINFEPGRDVSISDSKSCNSNQLQDNISLEERQMLGRYGIWLLVGRCTPTPDTQVEVLGRLLSMLFHWFHVTAYSYDGQIELTLEKLKVEHVCGWLKDISKTNYKEFIACLLPHPPEYGRVGGHWDTLASRTSHLKEGLHRLICLVPYEIITSEIWDVVMPHWMEAITNDVPEKELPELKIVLSKILDPDMSPLGLDAKTMYNFVTIRFEKTTAKVQQQALHWLQILTKLEILIPLTQLFAMFGDGVRIMKHGVQHEIWGRQDDKIGKSPHPKDMETVLPPRRSSISPVVEDDSGNTSAISDDEVPTSKNTEFSSDSEQNLICCILMLDILLKQMEFQDVETHTGIFTSVCENVCRLLKCMVTAARVGLGSHVCSLKVSECAYCEASVMWHQLSTKLVQFIAPEHPIRAPDPPIFDFVDEEKSVKKSPPESEKDSKNRDRDGTLSITPFPIPLGPLGGFAGPVSVAVPQPEPHSVGGVLVHMPHVCSMSERGRDTDIARFIHATDEIMTATVETVSEQLDLAAVISTEKVVTAVATSVTISDADVATATVHVTKPQLIGVGNESIKISDAIDNDGGDDLNSSEDFWHTSVGKFKFSLDSLPQPLQYIYQLLKELPHIEKPDILYYMLQCLNILALHGDIFTKAARDQRGFFIWCQENLLIKNLWNLCNAEHSQICQQCVPLLLHCITLPLGSDMFWRVVQEAFHDSDWRVRFNAVERVTVITRFMDSTPLRSEVGLQTALATAFCHLIASMDDINVHVAQRATLYLGTIHDTAIRSLLFCLESQFDLFIIDRPVILQSLYQLHNSLSDRRVLSWEFFLNRFDTLFVEAQINLEKNGDISLLRDLRNSENGSEMLSSKISKAREALNQSDSNPTMAKTLSASFGTKWPYKRTMSAPASIITRQESKSAEKEKIYNRQISAPILKRKSSRFGLGQFLGGNNHSVSSSVVPSPHSHHHFHHIHHHLHINCAPQCSQQYQVHLQHTPHLQSAVVSSAPNTPNLIATHSNLHFQQQQQQFGFNVSGGIVNTVGGNVNSSGIGIGAPDGQIHSFIGGGDEGNLAGCLQKIIDLEEADKETIHLLVFLLMQFLSRVDQAYPTDEKPLIRVQTIVLRHLYLLLGYSQTEKMFHITPNRLRSTAVFNVFIVNLPQVLDQNHLIGWTILPSALQVLLYAPNPSNLNTEFVQTFNFSYSIWYLEPIVRRSWLMAVLVILYKYQYTQIPFTGHINNIIRIVLNCLEAQFHQCRRIPETILVDINLGNRPTTGTQNVTTDEEKQVDSTPPSPICGMEGASHFISLQTKTKSKTGPNFRKYQDSSLEADDTESELVAIPESDLSDSTIQESSARGSFDDPLHFDEICAPFRNDLIKARVTTANLATAHVAMSTLAAGDILNKYDSTKKTNKSLIKPSIEKNIEPTTNISEQKPTPNILTQAKCSLQEGVRMMVTPSMLVTRQPESSEKAILSHAVMAQKTIAVTKNVPTMRENANYQPVNELSTKAVDKINEPIIEYIKVKKNQTTNGIVPITVELAPHNVTLSDSIIYSMGDKIIGRHKKIIEPSITPTSTPVQQSGSSSNDDTIKTKISNSRNIIKQTEKITMFNYGSPDSPMSKMNIMSPPEQETTDGLLSPKDIAQLELPTPERLLPIGQHNKESISLLVDKVREVLAVPDISHLKHDSSDKSESTKEEITASSRGNSPRKLTKQIALESPPNNYGTFDDMRITNMKSVTSNIKLEKVHLSEGTLHTQRTKLRKVGLFAMDSQGVADHKIKYAGSWAPPVSKGAQDDYSQTSFEYPPSFSRVGDDFICDRCSECGVMQEEYSDEEIGLLIISLGTFIHREPALAAPFLPEILNIVSKIALHSTFQWQCESSTHLPGGSQSVGHQFIRCVLHQLAPNGVFYQIFMTQTSEKNRKKFFRSIAQALVDFGELNPTHPIQLLVENLNSKKTLPLESLPIILKNLSEYFRIVPMDGIGTSVWSVVMQGIETFFRRLILVLPNLKNAEYLLDIMVAVLKIPAVSKGILDPFSKVLSFTIQNLPIKHKTLHDLCFFNNRAFAKERDRMQLCRQIVFELIQALKFKTTIPDGNILILVGFVLQDAGGQLPEGLIENFNEHVYTNNAAECMKQYLNDILDFLADFHTLSKIKNFKNSQITTGLAEDTLGGVLKGSVAQFLSLEMARGNSRDNKAVSRYLPWLFNAPSSLQQGPKEFTDCVGHMRLLSWLLMGSLTHTALLKNRGGKIGLHGAAVHYHLQHPGQSTTQPVPQEASCHIADHIQVIFAGFAEQSKTSVVHMSSLFHAFTLCQLWTVYLEQQANLSPPSSETHNITMGILFEFWAKVTPCILQLVSHAKLSEMVNLHFLSLLEALHETRSTILAKLLPLWCPVLSSNSQLSGTLHVRLQNCRDLAPSHSEDDTAASDILLKWLQRLQFKMGQIELQSSTATQFYSI